MEQDYIEGLYHSLGMSVGAEFSSEDVSLLYRKVFHVSSDTSEANLAIKKITACDNSWSCNGDNILGVLLEMESEREKKEMLYWDLQLVNAGNLAHMMDWMHQNTDNNTYNSQSGSLLPCTAETASIHTTKRKNRACGQVANMRKVKKAARECWASLASGGVQSIFPPPCQGQRTGRCQAWGWVSMSDLLLLVEVKYDVVTRLLYTEMLQEYHTESVWKMLLPWQQHKEVEELGDLAEEALESVDVLSMSELPGAFRMYQDIHTNIKDALDGSACSCPESQTQSWSAVSFLNDVHAFRQQERQTLTVHSERLHRESLRLVCLQIRLATLRAQREKKSRSALLAARQYFGTWPRVISPCRAEQVTLWLYGDEEEEVEDMKEDIKTQQQRREETWVCSQQALLQLLVLSQEKERKHLVKLVNGVSLEDLLSSGCTAPSKDESNTQAALRSGCVKRLRQIYAWLQTHNQRDVHLQSKFSLEKCAVVLLTHLVEVHEVQTTLLLQALIDENTLLLQALQDKYESEIRAQCFSNLLHLLTSDTPLPSGPDGYPGMTENSRNEAITAKSCYSRQAETQNVSGKSAEGQKVNSSKEARRELQEVQPTADTNKQDVCSGCGAAMEDLPYLEILCASDAKRDIEETLPAEGGAQTEEEESATKTLENYEKQASLITLAWSKPPEDGTDDEVEAGGAGQSLGVESSVQISIQPTRCEEEENQRGHKESNPAVLQSSPENQQCSPMEQPDSTTTPIADQPEKEEAISEPDSKMVSESLQGIRPPDLADSTETDPHLIDFCTGNTNATGRAGTEQTGGEMCPTAEELELWDQTGPVTPQHEDLSYDAEASVAGSMSESKATKEPHPMEKGRIRAPVSAVEREKTMRNLVDMQRKFEQKQQRDRERQMLRVQERLSIVQNRKAEEDLLGLKHTERLKHLTQDLPLEDRNQQKTIVRERLEQLRRERSYIMQSKRDKNTTGFRELLGPVVIHSREAEEGADWDTTTV